MGCVLPAIGTDGITRMVRACVDGPVFRGDLVRWDDVGTIPFDALGAPGWKPRGAAPGAAATSAMPALPDRRRGASMPADLRTRLGQLELPSPILAASGCAGAGRELAQFIDVARIGAVITKSVTLEPRAGNPAPRLAETPSGLLSSPGLQGPGIDGFLQRDLPWLLSRGARAVVSVAGHTVREYAELAVRLSDAAGVSAIEVNLGCPDASSAGRPFALDATAAAQVVAASARQRAV